MADNAARDLADPLTFVSRNLTTRIVREWVREVMVPDALLRLKEIGHGETLHPVPVALPPGQGQPARVEVVMVAAPPNVQVSALSKIVDVGAPRPRQTEGEGAKLLGVMVLGQEGPAMQAAREIAQRQRTEERGLPPPREDYKPPPGHQVVVIEDDLSGVTQGPTPDDPPAPPAKKAPTKAQQIAARRKANKRKRS